KLNNKLRTKELTMEEFAVERIERKRVVNGVTEYFLKWKGYPRSQNTWEPVNHLYCKDLIAAFEASAKNKPLLNTKRKSAAPASDTKAVIRIKKGESDENKKFGFDRGLEASKIIGATDSSGKLMFLMSWKNSDRLELVPAKLANVMCPQIVINFYEERLTWGPYAGNVK
ncbi:hypothetical protein KR044_004165, partial [Drosophila immigrans]